jgi:anti-sigma factor RsiW
MTEQERENLIAYLDGELHGEAARAIEAKISRDPAIRKEAESLKRTWAMLDFLPRPAPSPSFTEQTLSRISPVQTGRMPALWPRWRWWLLGLGWAASLLLAGWAGYAGYSRLAPPPEPGEKELLRDLRIIENKRMYEAAGDIDFLRALDHPDLFGEEQSAP